MTKATVYGNAQSFRTQKVLVAAKYGDKQVDVKDQTPPSDKFPLGLTPAFEDGQVHLFGAEAIAKHLASGNASYVPKDPALDQWLLWSEGELLPNVLAYVLPSLSYAHLDNAAIEQAKQELLAQLRRLDTVLLTRTYLVGERLSAADVSVSLNLLAAFQHVLDAKARENLVNVTRWFQTVVNQKHVKEVGEVKLAEHVATFNLDAYKKHASAAPKKDGGKKHDNKKPEQPKQPAKDNKPKEKTPKQDEPEDDTPAEPNNEEVVLWMNTIGPYSNRQETYSYFSLPLCKGTKETIEHYHETLGEALLGVELEYSGIDIRFKAQQEKTEYCHRALTAADVDALTFAIQHNYWYQMYLDDLPLWALLGETDPNTKAVTIYTHKRFEIGYNDDRIVDVSVVVEAKKPLVPNQELSFTYEVIWKPSNVPFDKRFDKYLDPTFFQHRIHWFSIFNSFMMVIFLVGLVWMILLRTLSKDYARYHRELDLEADEEINDDYGWKQVHGDVFRPPQFPLMFCSLIGTGYHLISVLFITIGLAIISEFYTERGSLLSATIFVYAICAPVNGFFGGSMYSRVGGQNWIKQMVFGAFLFPGFLAWIALTVNTVAIYYHASRAIPFTSMLSIFFICAFVILPLNFVGTLLGRNLKGQADIPCRINVVPRPIPDKKWYLEPTAVSIIAGFLPFGSIFIEMYFIFTSFWAYKIYYVYGFMLLVAIILVVVVACVTIVATYFLLNSEDYRWRWSSFMAGGSISVYIYMYSVYYYFFKTKMYGLFQTTFYFGYMGIASVGIGILCGTIGYIASASFVHKIYSRIKLD